MRLYGETPVISTETLAIDYTEGSEVEDVANTAVKTTPHKPDNC